MASSMDKADVDFLQSMHEHVEEGIAIARAYLDASNPKVRQARVADLARSLVTTGMQQLKTMQQWLVSSGVKLDADGDTDGL